MSENTSTDSTKADEKAAAKAAKKATKAKAKAKKPAAKKPAAKKPAVRRSTGPWRETLGKAAEQFNKVDGLTERTAKEKKRAGILLWDGAQSAITEWDSAADPTAEVLSDEVKAVLGESRKGDVSKIKTVARAVAEKGLDMGDYANLSQAYSAARLLSGEATKAKEEEDAAADEAVASIKAPTKPSTIEDAAALVLSKGVDEAARLLNDALGADNNLAHRALFRALAEDTAGRIKPEPKAKAKATPKDGAEVANTDTTEAAPKAKPAVTKAKPVAKAAPVKAEAPVEEALPVEDAAPAKAAPAKATARPAAKKAVARPVKRG